MRLTTQTDFALRTLIYLATFGGRATAADVAGLFDISTHHVAKVVNLLSRLGYVRSIRGIGGGIELARSPESIRLGDVIEAFEGNMNLLECVSTEGVCVIEQFCKLKNVLSEAERLQLEYLNSKTLRDVVPTKQRLRGVAAV